MPQRSGRPDGQGSTGRPADDATPPTVSGTPQGSTAMGRGDPASTGEVLERGAFAVARCERCGWQGAARRSRKRARQDLAHHLDDQPEHADRVSLAEVAPAP